MHTEHLQNVSPFWVIIGWLVALAATSVVVLALGAAGLLEAGGSAGVPDWWSIAAVGIGFFVGGYLTGTRDIEAPILHGVGIGLTTLVAWFVLNVVAAAVSGHTWIGLSPTSTIGVLLLQMVAAVAGSWLADSRAVSGEL